MIEGYIDSIKETYDGTNTYTICPIRGRIILETQYVLKSEEYVRIGFLKFLVNELKLKDIIGVEKDNIDILLYYKNFSCLPPILITETKRMDLILSKTERKQLFGYFKVKKCNFGILTNGIDFYCYEVNFTEIRNESGIKVLHIKYKKPFKPKTITELKSFINKAIESFNKTYSNELNIIKNAQNGNFESFKFIVTQFPHLIYFYDSFEEDGNQILNKIQTGILNKNNFNKLIKIT